MHRITQVSTSVCVGAKQPWPARMLGRMAIRGPSNIEWLQHLVPVLVAVQRRVGGRRRALAAPDGGDGRRQDHPLDRVPAHTATLRTSMVLGITVCARPGGMCS